MRDMFIGAAICCGVYAFAVQFVIPLVAQTQSPGAINGCVVLTAQVTMTNLQNSSFICDQNGRLKVTTSVP